MMSGFDPSELLPFYLDETDEQIGAINDALLQLEENPGDQTALQEVFRLVHSLKGSAGLMGFDEVGVLAHHLESLFDQLRSGTRELDRSAVELSFRCLDQLRDYHRELRAEGQGHANLVEVTNRLLNYLGIAEPGAEPTTEPNISEESALQESEPPTIAEDLGAELQTTPGTVTVDATEGTGPTNDEPIPSESSDGNPLQIKVQFSTGLQLLDLKAQLILNRLTERVRLIKTDPPTDQLDSLDQTGALTIWVEPGLDARELRELASVDGVKDLQISAGLEVPSAEPEILEETTPEQSDAEPSNSVPSNSVSSDAEPSNSELAITTPATSSLSPTEPSRFEQSEPESAEETTDGVAHSAIRKRVRIAETLRVDIDRLDALMNLAGELVIIRDRFADLASTLNETIKSTSTQVLASDALERLETVRRGLIPEDQPEDSPYHASSRWSSQFQRLQDDLQRVETDLGRIRSCRERLGALLESVDQLGRLSDGIQRAVLDTRMVPIGPILERFRRVIRDLSLDSEKSVDLVIEGESTELDKRMIDEISDPLIHLVRNAVDHGIESTQDRLKLGKPATGTISLNASNRGNRVMISIRDDGRGIDAVRLRGKVIEKGLARSVDIERLSDDEVIPFIFEPGFSTAAKVTSVSGRGVGLDVVKERVEKLNGAIAIETELGVGTTFHIQLPLTIAILPSMLVLIDGVTYAIPVADISEILSLAPEQILHVHGERTLFSRDRFITLIELADVFEWPRLSKTSSLDDHENDLENGNLRTPTIIVQSRRSSIALVVDQLLGLQDVVLRSIEKNYRSVNGIAGAGILGDGRVALVLDIDALVSLALNRSFTVSSAP